MLEAVVVGAGPAGLSVSHELMTRGVEHVLLERGDGAGHSWTRAYDSLRLHTGKHLSSLPGRPFPRSASLFPSAAEFLEYLREYATVFDLPLRTRSGVRSAVHDGECWQVETPRGPVRARTLVMATGIMSNPWMPDIPGRDVFSGTVLHSSEYRRPDPFTGRRVLVVGVGNSAGEMAPELARAGAEVTIAIRSGANVVPRTVVGIPIQYVAWAALRLPGPVRRAAVAAFARVSRAVHGASPLPPSSKPLLDDVPLIGFGLVHAIQDGHVRVRGGLERFTPEGVRFGDGSEEPFDDVLLATGFRAELGPLGGLVSRDGRGFARRRGRVVSAEQPDLYFVGHHYDSAGALYNISLDATTVANAISGAPPSSFPDGKGPDSLPQ